MTGNLLQLFDYQEMLTTGHITRHSLKRNPIGGSHLNNGASETNPSIMCNRSMPMEKHFSKPVQDKPTIYTDTSRFPSPSKPHSSSFSSPNYFNKTSQQDALLFDPLMFPERCSTDPRMSQLSTSTQLYMQTHYLREVVKDSMHRESRGQTSKTNATDKVADSLAEQRNSQTALNQNDVSFFSTAKEAPRFSYDGKEILHSSFKQRDVSKSSSKYQDMARLSLDSRESSIRSLKSEPQLKLSRNHQQNTGTQIRSPSVVAKLMGLEALPNSVPYNESKSNTSRPIHVSVQSKVSSKESNSPHWKNPGSSIKPVSRLPVEPAPWKQVDEHQRSPIARNSCPSIYSEIEKRLKDLEFSESGKDLIALKQILEAMQEKGEDPRKYTKLMPDGTSTPKNELIYSFTKQGGKFSRDYESPIVIMKPTKNTGKSDYPVSVFPVEELSNRPKSDGRSSADGKASRSNTPVGTSRDNISSDTKSNSRVSKSTQTSTRSLQSAKEGSTGSLRSNGSVSQRIPRKKLESERRSGPHVPSLTDSGRSTRHSDKQGTGSSTTSGRRRSNSSRIQRNDDEKSEISIESTNLSSIDYDNSAQSDGSILSESRMDVEIRSILSESRVDVEVTSSETSLDMFNYRSPFKKTLHSSVSCMIEKVSTIHCGQDELLMEHPAIAPEYPSPVSVLDNILDMDDSPSPIKHKVNTSRGYETQDSDILPSSNQHNAAANLFSNAVGSAPPSEFNRKKLKNIENLVQKLQRVNSSHDEARTDYIASLCENKNPDHRYISEILLASGFLLSDIGTSMTNFQFHSSGHPINPGLFLVLEQTKASSFLEFDRPPKKTTHLKSKQKIHRKLIFDSTNEVLARKLASLEPSTMPWLRYSKLARKTLNSQKLLRELCFEIDELQAKETKGNLEINEDDGLRNLLREDVMHPSEGWWDNMSNVSGIVLDVERLIFKDLVDEVLVGETPGLKNKTARRRQLFTK